MTYILIVLLFFVIALCFVILDLETRIEELENEVVSNLFYLNILDDAIDDLYEEVYPDDCDVCVAPKKTLTKKKK